MAYSYQRRNEIAREKGFKNYAEYRKITEYAKKSGDFRNFVGEKVGGREGANLKDAKEFYEAFGNKKNADNYSVDSPKAKWLIMMGYVQDRDHWRDLYPTGTRYGHLLKEKK